MDAHYFKVMKAREDVQETGTKLYFAYSSVLDREAFEEWRQEHSYQFFNLSGGKVAKVVDQDLVFNFNSRWWGGRVASLESKKGVSVYGLLFEVPAKDWPVVQHKEGFITGMCIESPVKVEVDGKEVEAIAFITAPQRATQAGPVSPGYVKTLIRGAKDSGLPQNYIQKLESLVAST